MRRSILLLSLLVAPSLAAQSYEITHTYNVGGEGGWDYVIPDAPNHRLFIGRSNRVMVVDMNDGRLLGEEAAQSRNELAVRTLQLEKLTAALSGQARSNMVALNMNSRLLLENYGGFLPRRGHECAEQMKEAAAEMERLRQDLVGTRASSGNGRAA